MEFLLRKRNDLKASSFARSGGDHHGFRSHQKCVNCGNDSPPEVRNCHLQDLHLAVVLSDLVKTLMGSDYRLYVDRPTHGPVLWQRIGEKWPRRDKFMKWNRS